MVPGRTRLAQPVSGIAHPGADLWLGVHLNLGAAVLAGLLAGLVFLALELLAGFVFGVGVPFGPAYVTLHGLVGAEGSPEILDPVLVGGAVFLHFLLSVAMTIPLAILIHPWKHVAVATSVGAVLGVLLFYLNEALLASLLPIWNEMRYVLMLVHYTAFGMLAALTYKWLQRRRAS